MNEDMKMDSEMAKYFKDRYNAEKKTWMYGILIWLVSFLALQILGLIWHRIQITNIIINAIVLVLIGIMYSRFINQGKIKNAKKD